MRELRYRCLFWPRHVWQVFTSDPAYHEKHGCPFCGRSVVRTYPSTEGAAA